MKKVNDYLAEKITIAFSTMWAFYLFIIYGLTPLVWPQYMDKILYYSNFIQLIALPALAVGSIVLSKKQETKNQAIYEAQEKRAQETHDAVMQEMTDMKQIHEENQQELAEVKELLELLKKG